MPKQYIEIGVALVIVVASALGMADARNYPGASGYVPIAVLIFSIILALIWIGQSIISLRRNAEPLSINRTGIVRFSIFSCVAVLYAICFSLIGFYTSTLLMIPLVSGLLGYRHWKVSFSTSVVFLVVLNLVFNLLLKTPLPPELIMRLKDLL